MNYKYGDVIYWRNYRFDDGITGNKLLIVLSKPEGSSKCVSALTTSVPPPFDLVAGCNEQPRTMFKISQGTCKLKKETIVQLYRAEIYVLEPFSQDIKILFNLGANLTGQIKNCLKRAIDIYPEVKSLL